MRVDDNAVLNLKHAIHIAATQRTHPARALSTATPPWEFP
jgi:hypothetical protein